MTRRSFISYAAAAMGGFLGAFLATPLIGSFVSPALKKAQAGHWKNLGAVAKFQVSAPRAERVSLIKKDGWVTDVATRLVWVVRLTESDFVVYNSQCTHLGCLVEWHSESKTFRSPCHNGVFKMDDGAVLAGPPPRPLDTLEIKIEDNELWVNYQDFRLGVHEKIPI